MYLVPDWKVFILDDPSTYPKEFSEVHLYIPNLNKHYFTYFSDGCFYNGDKKVNSTILKNNDVFYQICEGLPNSVVKKNIKECTKLPFSCRYCDEGLCLNSNEFCEHQKQKTVYLPFYM